MAGVLINSGVAQAQAFKELLQKYVIAGQVNYGALGTDSLFHESKKFYEEFDYSKEDSATRMAHLINAYNFMVIKQVVEHYPVGSPMEITGFFDIRKHNIAGQMYTLDHLENEVLRKQYFDPRLHFVLVCGAVSCPPISQTYFTRENINEAMDERTYSVLNASWFVYEQDGHNHLSQIFKWYGEDFGKTNKELLTYINHYRTDDLDVSADVKYYPYDWTLNSSSQLHTKDAGASSDTEQEQEFNLQTYTAGSLLGKRQMDFTIFNSMYTENANNWLGTRFSGYRSTFVTSWLQWTVGIDRRKRFNLGLDLTIRANGRTSADSSFAAINRAFEFTNTDSTRFGLTSVGLRVKVQPFKEVADFTIQSTLSVPVIQHPEGNFNPGEEPLTWADWNRITWWNQFFYTKMFGDFQLFTEADLWFRFGVNSDQIDMLDTPVSVFISYFPTPKVTFYLMTQHLHRFTNNIEPRQNGAAPSDWVVPASYTASGAGFKYQFSDKLNIELLYTDFWRSQNNGLGNTFNLGIKYITGS